MTTTTVDWRTMPAGRELDALVAERVFGYTTRKRVEREQDRNLFTGKKIPGRFTEHDVWEECKPGSREWSYLWRYSIAIDAAWRVLGVLHGDTERWAAFTVALPEVLGGMHATALHELEVSQAALAICRAALAYAEDHIP